MGNAFLKLGKEDLAYKDLSTAIELDANFYQAYYNRGTLLKRLGKSSMPQSPQWFFPVYRNNYLGY
jgi:tetratricopeptide (TPR) repeat protein